MAGGAAGRAAWSNTNTDGGEPDRSILGDGARTWTGVVTSHAPTAAIGETGRGGPQAPWLLAAAGAPPTPNGDAGQSDTSG